MTKTAILPFVIVAGLLLAACGPQQASTPAAAATSIAPAGPVGSDTPDPCAQENLSNAVKPVNAYMVQFDQFATLASNVIQSQLSSIIPAMQQVRQAANAHAVPVCLTELKKHELQYMDTTLATLRSFQSTPQAATLTAGILMARQYHDEYVYEMARLLGVTVTVLASGATQGAQAPAQPAETTTPAPSVVLNPGPNPLNMHVSPSLTSQAVGVLDANQQTRALGKSANDEWVLIEIPGQPGKSAWVYASLLQFSSGGQNLLPIATP
jgi:hypothetical protein